MDWPLTQRRTACTALNVMRSPLLVTHAQHGKVEWLRVTHLRAHLAPWGGDRAVGEFDQVERVLNVLVQAAGARQPHSS